MQGDPIACLWLIPALPLAAAAVGAVTPRRGRAVAAGAAIAGLLASLVFSIAALVIALRTPSAHLSHNFAWFDLGQDQVRLGWLLDPLTAFMAVMVSLVGTLIFIFSIGYMKEDGNFTRFFCFLSLFAAAMLGLVVSNSLLLLFVCWELVGLASYLLIGFWFEKPEAAAAAKKAFITTRIGDLGFLLGVVWLYNSAGTLLLYDGGHGLFEGGQLGFLGTHFVRSPFPGLALSLSAAISLLLFCGAIGKSGQFPLHVWLPDAMEGPTPVSALIHAATMVAAGVFLVARVYPLMSIDQLFAAPGGGSALHALSVVAFIGAITALLGAVIAVAQNDIKRVLAFSTISQLGYMMLALGVGSWVAAIFHLLTHAFFKALLFLGAGSVIASTHHEQDIRRLGGLAPRLRATFATFAVGMMALSGVPFLFSGFWSKEAILHAANAWSVSRFPLYAGLAGVVLTAFYMTRLICEVFFGSPRSEPAAHAHENPAVMTVPLTLLALGSIGLGFLGTPAWPWLQSKLSGTPIESRSLLEGGGLLMLSIFLVAIGLGSGWALYWRRTRTDADAPDPIEKRMPRLFAFLAARLKIDELYAATFGRMVSGLASLSVALDRRVWGGCVDFVAGLGNFAGLINREADESGLNAGFDSAGESLRATGRAYSTRQTGETHGYLKAVAIAFAVLAILAIAGGGQ
jgi:NADH-quinone oxidoreductase subunit L